MIYYHLPRDEIMEKKKLSITFRNPQILLIHNPPSILVSARSDYHLCRLNYDMDIIFKLITE